MKSERTQNDWDVIYFVDGRVFPVKWELLWSRSNMKINLIDPIQSDPFRLSFGQKVSMNSHTAVEMEFDSIDSFTTAEPGQLSRDTRQILHEMTKNQHAKTNRN